VSNEFYDKRTSWCSGLLQTVRTDAVSDSAALSPLHADLDEHEAALEEANGSVQQIDADIALVQRTIAHAETMLKGLNSEKGDLPAGDDRHLLEALLSSRRELLTSLHGELELTLPSLTQLQSQVAVVRCRIADRTESATAMRALEGAVKDDCKRGEERANQQASLRAVGEKILKEFLLVLEGGVKAWRRQEQLKGSSRSNSAIQLSEQVSFLQTDLTDDDVLSAVDDRPDERQSSVAQMHSEVRVQRQAATVKTMTKAAEVEASIRSLLVGMRQEISGSVADHSQWCAQERGQNELAARLAEDSAGEMEAQIAAHVSAVQQLGEESQRLESSAASLNSTQQNIENIMKEELALIARNTRTHVLASKILAQAMSIIDELKNSGGFVDDSEHPASTLMEPLKAAKATFERETEVASEWQHEVQSARSELLQKLVEVTGARDHERISIKLMQEQHGAERVRGVENLKAYRKEAEVANQFLLRLKDECSSGTHSDRQRAADMRVHAMQDAEQLLRSATDPESSSQNQRHSALANGGAGLSPLERAAREMGVSE